MWSLLFPRTEANLIAALWEHGTAGILEDGDGLRAFFEDTLDPEALAYLGGQFRVESEPMNIGTADSWEPFCVGERFYLVPPGYQGEIPGSRLKLELQSGAAFGTGRHETTQLCLEAIERIVSGREVMLDTGSGSGILSAAARLLGITRLFACDIDANAAEMTRRQSGAPVFTGSADAIKPEVFDLIVANLTGTILDQLAWDLHRILKPGGSLLLSGFLAEKPPLNFRASTAFERDGWLCWVCRREEIAAAIPPSDGLTHAADWWL